MQQNLQVNNQETALKILIQGINLAQSRGAFNLPEAELLSKCIKMFTQRPDPIGVPDTVIEDDNDKNVVEDENVEIENISI